MRRVTIIGPLLALSLLLGSCGSDDSPAETTTTTEAEPEPTTTTEPEPDRTEDRKALVLAPVMSSGGCPAEMADTPEGPAIEGGTYATADGVFCYTIGAPAADGNDLTDATLSETDGSFLVYVRVKDNSIDELNAFFNLCFAGDPSCPAGEGGRGYVAIIWDGTVLYAPAIQAEDLATSGLSLAGGLTERRARDLITVINR